MRWIGLVGIFMLHSLIVASVNAQTVKPVAPPPGDPFEAATGSATIADTPEKRSSILNLLERARQNNNLHMNGMSAFDLKVSFNVGGSTPYAGAGDLEESWLSNATWKWSAHLGTYSQSRIFYNGVAYDANPHTYLPMRLAMIRQAIFWPISGNFANQMIRVAETHWNGKALTCALISGPLAKGSLEAGRQWNEEEFCIDPSSGLLQAYSIAPGVYDLYDYSDALQFHGRSIPRRITIVENSAAVVEIQLNQLEDLTTSDATVFTPSTDMKGPGIMIGEPMRISQSQSTNSAMDTIGVIQPVIVHAALDAGGKVLEAEALQWSNSALSQAALKLVKNTNYGPARGRETLQRDVFINVQFVSPPQ